MTKERLKLFRLLIPGILIFIVLYPFMQGGLALDGLLKIDTAHAAYVLLVLVLGGIYRTLGIRGLLFKDKLDDVHENLKKGLIAPFLGELDTPCLQKIPAEEFLKVFYYFVDKDSSLQAKTQDVYENGLLWSSYADLGVISAIGFIFYTIAYAVSGIEDYFFFTVMLISIHVISWPLIKKSVGKHKKLSDEQLKFITFHYQSELKEKLQRLLTAQSVAP